MLAIQNLIVNYNQVFKTLVESFYKIYSFVEHFHHYYSYG